MYLCSTVSVYCSYKGEDVLSLKTCIWSYCHVFGQYNMFKLTLCCKRCNEINVETRTIYVEVIYTHYHREAVVAAIDIVSYGRWCYTCIKCQFFLFPMWHDISDTPLFGTVCQWQWFSQISPVSAANNTDHHDIIEILLKVALSTTTLTLRSWYISYAYSMLRLNILWILYLFRCMNTIMWLPYSCALSKGLMV